MSNAAPNDIGTPAMDEATPAPTAPQPPQAPAATHVSGAPRQRLSTFLKVSIILLAALSIAAISLVFVGDFEGKVERITATFLIFAVFVGLTAADTSRGQKDSWYAPVALIANSYVLGLLLIVTWMSEGGFLLGAEIFWKSLLVIAVTRAVVACCQVLLRMGDGRPETLARFAFITSVLAVVSGILFTAPLAIEVFSVEIPELYWKIAVAALLLTGLGLAITLLVRWSYGTADRDARRRVRVAQSEAAVHNPATAQPVLGATHAPAPASGQPAQLLLPWPTFADGRPLPARSDGQPDFSLPGAPLPPSN